MKFNKGYVKLHFLVVLWGFTAILGLLIKLSFIEVVFYRTLLSVVPLALILVISKVGFSINPREGMKLILTGVVIAVHWLLFFGAARYSNASVSLIGLSTVTFWTSLLEPLLHKRKLSWIEILFGLSVAGALFIIFGQDFSYGLGLAMSLLSALLAAFFSVLNYGYVRKHSALTITFYEMVGALLGTIPFLWILTAPGQVLLSLPSWSDMGYLLILAIICTVYANIEATRLLRQFSAFASNLVINLEPIYGILLALLFFGDSEKMNLSFYVGAGVLTFVVFLYPMVLKRVGEKCGRS